jgi:hypothetical protein
MQYSSTSFPADHSHTYSICVLGNIDPVWANRISGMELTPDCNSYGSQITRLHGSVRDQAELMGIINLLYDLGLTLLSVQNAETALQLSQLAALPDA